MLDDDARAGRTPGRHRRCSTFAEFSPLSSVLEIPRHLLLALMAALAPPSAGGHAPSAETLSSSPPAAVSAANPYAFGRTSLHDAIHAQRGDLRFARYALRVFKTSSGEIYVPVMREALEMRALASDPVIARHLTERYGRYTAAGLAEALGRPPTLSDLYLAHRLGLRNAIEFRRIEAAMPDRLAVVAVSGLDDDSSDLLFTGDRGRSLAEVSQLIDRGLAAASARGGLPPPKPHHALAPENRAARVMGWSVEVERAPRRRDGN